MEEEQLGFDFPPAVEYVWFADWELWNRWPQNCECHLMIVYEEDIPSRQWYTRNLDEAFEFLLSALIPCGGVPRFVAQGGRGAVGRLARDGKFRGALFGEGNTFIDKGAAE